MKQISHHECLLCQLSVLSVYCRDGGILFTLHFFITLWRVPFNGPFSLFLQQSRWALICVLCRERVGACIQCSVKTCKIAYHVTCAFKHGLEMKAIIEDESADDGVKLRVSLFFFQNFILTNHICVIDWNF